MKPEQVLSKAPFLITVNLLKQKVVEHCTAHSNQMQCVCLEKRGHMLSVTPKALLLLECYKTFIFISTKVKKGFGTEQQYTTPRLPMKSG